MRVIFSRGMVFLASLLIPVIVVAWCYLTFVPVIVDEKGLIDEVRPGLSKEQWVAHLHALGVVHYPALLLIYTKLHPIKHLKTGEYFFKKGATQSDLFKQVSSGNGFYYHAFTIIPGWTFKKIRQALSETPALKQTLPGLTNEAVMAALSEPDVQPEGLFLPETYRYAKGVPDIVILKEARALMKKTLESAWETRSPGLPFDTPYDALIAASLVQMEAYLPEEKPMIAGVLINRLNQHMRLQFDPTVIYGMGDYYQGVLSHADLHADTPYNTYVHTGLPPTPIAMPGQEAIAATLHPAVHPYLYFVAKGNGAHTFSETLTAHKEAIKSWIALPPKDTTDQPNAFFNMDKARLYLFQAIIADHHDQALLTELLFNQPL